MAQISILGCGWLGLPLAKQLIAQGHSVKGTTTTPDKVSLLHETGITPYVITLHEDKPEGDINAFLNGSDILIIDVPPGIRKNTNESFTAKINALIPDIVNSGVAKVLFISSTSVYGAVNGTITEATTPNPETESGRQLIEVESLLQSKSNFKTTVLRFGGLIGGDRHPVHHLAGKENINNPDAPVNLIHRDDCIGIIEQIIEKGAWGEIFNGVTPYHPTRQEYYTEKAKEKNLPIPLFSREEVSITKVIVADKVKQVLKYGFVRNNL